MVGPSLRSLHEERRLGVADLGVDDAENLGKDTHDCMTIQLSISIYVE